MKSFFKSKYFITFIVATLIISLFLFSAALEYSRGKSESKQELQNQIQIVSVEVNKFVNQSIRNANGIVAFIQMNPDLNQEDFEAYSSKILNKDDQIISHFVAVKDTTIVFAYPLAGNEGAIGVDLSQVDGQKDDVLKIKNELISLFTGPVELVQGGKRLINRMPIVMDGDEYWGQLSLVIRYEEMLQAAGVEAFAEDHYIAITQDGMGTTFQNVIYSNYDDFSSDAVELRINVPNGSWLIKTEDKWSKGGNTFVFYMLLVLGLVFSVVLSIGVYYVLKVNESLNQIVDLRTEAIQQSNYELEASLLQLKDAQNQLVMREKHAALGELVAGVAHEINTPLGVCVTVNSFIETTVQSTQSKLETNALKKSELVDTFDRIKESSLILRDNLERASKLVFSFKKLSTDQYLEEFRNVNLNEYLQYIINTISPTFKNTKHVIHLNVSESINIQTYPSALTQVFTNLIMNSLIHGFENVENGVIQIDALESKNQLVMDYRDNGIGIPESLKEKIFDPFFTTKRDAGSTGLGMHIIYNIVYQKLEGQIILMDFDEPGVHFQIILPNK